MHATLTGGVHIVRHRPQLQSAVRQVMQTWDGKFLYPTLYLMAAALLRSLAENQPFTDGNKRIAWTAAMVFLEVNGVTVTSSVEDAVDLMMSVARKVADISDVAEFLERNTTHLTESAIALLDASSAD